jgi:hypothetical protein
VSGYSDASTCIDKALMRWRVVRRFEDAEVGIESVGQMTQQSIRRSCGRKGRESVEREGDQSITVRANRKLLSITLNFGPIFTHFG